MKMKIFRTWMANSVGHYKPRLNSVGHNKTRLNSEGHYKTRLNFCFHLSKVTQPNLSQMKSQM